MTPDEEAYEETLRRIREAEQAGAVEFTLVQQYLTRILPELKRLTSLQTLNLSWCGQLSGDLMPLAGLTSLQELNLFGCDQVSDLARLAKLAALQWLDLGGCRQLSDISPLLNLPYSKRLVSRGATRSVTFFHWSNLPCSRI